MDAANMLKPMLARGELRMVGATTLAEYRKIERDGALARRFSPVTVEEPSVEETVEILRGLREAYEAHHGATIADEALLAAARLSDRYIPEYRLPDKAIDLIDQAAAKVRLRTGGARGHGEAAGRAATGSRPRSRPRSTPRPTRTRRRSRRTSTGSSSGSAAAEGAEAPVVGETDVAAVDRRPHRDPGGRAGGRRARAAAGPRDRPARARDRPGAGRRARRRHRAARPRRAVGRRQAARLVPVPRPDRRRQDRAGQGPLGAAVRDREGARPDRHVRVPLAAHGGAADRLAARLRRLRRRRPADRAGAPAARTPWSCSTRSRRPTRRSGTCCSS